MPRVTSPDDLEAEEQDTGDSDDDLEAEEQEGASLEDDRVAYCDSCEQESSAMEKELLPERQEPVKWAKKNWSKKLGKHVLAGRECYCCTRTRVKFHKGKKQKWVLKECSKSKKFKETFGENRRSIVRGECRYARGAGNASASVKSTQKRFEEEYEEGFFYQLDDWLALMKAPKLEGLQEKVNWAWSEHKTKVHRDKHGSYGVNEGMLPTGAKYKWRRGQAATNELEEIVPFEDADDAEAGFSACSQIGIRSGAAIDCEGCVAC